MVKIGHHVVEWDETTERVFGERNRRWKSGDTRRRQDPDRYGVQILIALGNIKDRKHDLTFADNAFRTHGDVPIRVDGCVESIDEGRCPDHLSSNLVEKQVYVFEDGLIPGALHDRHIGQGLDFKSCHAQRHRAKR